MLKEAASYGYEYSLINRLPKNRPKSEWVKGKGAPEGWVAVIKPGRILYEMEGVSREMAKEALRLASHKLSVKTKFIERNEE